MSNMIHETPITVKPSRLIVDTINRRSAVVTNNLDEHVVQFDDLTCSCGHHYCAAIFAALRERAAMKGGLQVMFTGNHMLTYLMARVLRRDGHAVSIHIEHSWYWLEYAGASPYAACRTTRTDEERITTAYQTGKDRLAFTRSGSVQCDVDQLF